MNISSELIHRLIQPGPIESMAKPRPQPQPQPSTPEIRSVMKLVITLLCTESFPPLP